MGILKAATNVRYWSWRLTALGLGLIGLTLLVVADSCLFNTDDQWIQSNPTDCTCQGTTLKCSNSQNSSGGSYPNSRYCDPNFLSKAGVCACNGADLTCALTIGITGATPTPTQVSLTMVPTQQWDTDQKNVKEGGFYRVVFTNSPVCSGPTVTPTETPADTPTVTAVQQNVSTQAPPTSATLAVCSPGWLPTAGCTCCGTTLTCADGTVAQFNPKCGVGGNSCPCKCDPAGGGCVDCNGKACTP